MTKTKVYKNRVSAAIHEMATDLHESGIIDKKNLREFDETCLTPIHEFTPEQIRALREREQVSQWERGEKRPAGTSLKLLSLIERKGLDAIA